MITIFLNFCYVTFVAQKWHTNCCNTGFLKLIMFIHRLYRQWIQRETWSTALWKNLKSLWV